MLEIQSIRAYICAWSYGLIQTMVFLKKQTMVAAVRCSLPWLHKDSQSSYFATYFCADSKVKMPTWICSAPIIREEKACWSNIQNFEYIHLRPCLDAVKAKRKFFVNRLHGILYTKCSRKINRIIKMDYKSRDESNEPN